MTYHRLGTSNIHFVKNWENKEQSYFVKIVDGNIYPVEGVLVPVYSESCAEEKYFTRGFEKMFERGDWGQTRFSFKDNQLNLTFACDMAVMDDVTEIQHFSFEEYQTTDLTFVGYEQGYWFNKENFYFIELKNDWSNRWSSFGKNEVKFHKLSEQLPNIGA